MDQQLWDRFPGETSRQFEAFKVYRDMGPSRSLDAACAQAAGRRRERGKRVTGTWGKWSSTWSWPDRAKAYDIHLEAVQQEAREHALRLEAEKWAQRRGKVLEAEYEVGVLLMDLARIRAQFVKTNRFAPLAHIAATAEGGSKLCRKGCRLPDEIEPAPVQNFHDLFFETSGQVAASLPEGAAPQMPPDVTEKPSVQSATDEAGKPGPAQPGLLRPSIMSGPSTAKEFLRKGSK
jgi:hypothetical protein